MSRPPKSYNARIKEARFCLNDHGWLSFEIILDGFAESFGNRALSYRDPVTDRIEGNRAAVPLIHRLFEITDAEEWSDIEGKYVRVVIDPTTHRMKKVGHIVDNVWMDIQELVNMYEGEING